MADKLSRLNVVPRVVRLLLLEMDLAARVAQNRFRVMRKRRQMRGSDLPVDVRMRQKMMQNMKTDDLNAKWRALKRSDGVAGVPDDATLAYQRLLLAMCTRDSSRYYRSARGRSSRRTASSRHLGAAAGPPAGRVRAAARGRAREVAAPPGARGAGRAHARAAARPRAVHARATLPRARRARRARGDAAILNA